MGDIADMYREAGYEDDWRHDAEQMRPDEKIKVLKSRTNKKIWTQRDGTPIAVANMSTSHLLNSYRLLKRKGFISPYTLACYLGPGPNGDIAQDCFQAEAEEIFNRPVSPWVNIFEEEIERRGLKRPEVEVEIEFDDEEWG